ARLRDLLGLYLALRAPPVLRLRLCLRRLPGELALRGLRARSRRLRQALPRDARGRRHQTPLRIACAFWSRRPRPRVLAGRARRDRAHDRRAGGVGITRALDQRLSIHSTAGCTNSVTIEGQNLALEGREGDWKSD